jgi:hypothetical protein
MSLAVQLMMAVSLAACAGLRAWLPMLVVGLLSRGDYVQLNGPFAFLARDDALIIFGGATVIEFFGDKVVAIDHFLDAMGTVIRPAVETVLASSMLAGMDPLAAVVFGLIVGGGMSLTVHAGKAVARAKVSALIPFHGGLGNAILSTAEDVISGLCLWIIIHAPLLEFILALFAIIGAAWLVMKFIKSGRRLFKFLKNRRRVHVQQRVNVEQANR